MNFIGLMGKIVKVNYIPVKKRYVLDPICSKIILS